MSVATIALLYTVLLFAGFCIGFEIAFSMGLFGFFGFAHVMGMGPALNIVAIDIYNNFVNYGLTVIPLFVLMGTIGANAGIAKRLYDCSYKFLGHIPGGLAISTIVGAVLFKAVCGSSTATAATFGAIAIPEMERYHYGKSLSSGTVATVGTLGALLPPSVALIIYGIISERSIAKLFLAGIIPGLLIAASFVLTIFIWCKINPSIAPKGEKSTWSERLKSIPSILPIAVVFLIVVGGIIVGYFTPTEAASVGTFIILMYSFAVRDISFKGFINAVLDSIGVACMILLVVAGATIFGHFFTATNIPFILADWLMSLPFQKEVIMLMIMIIYLIGGTVIEDLAFVILCTPIFIPVVTRLGYDLIWFGIMVMIVLMIGMVIPPIAMNIFVVSSMSKIPQNIVYRGVYPYLVGMVICLLIVLYFPQITLWLPNLIMQ